jgi:hypothetical protein
MRVVAVDWSGAQNGAAEKIWLAEAVDGNLVDLWNGLERPRVIDHLIALAEKDTDLVVGLDFAFSFPRWWCEERGWSSPLDVWAAMADEGEELVTTRPPRPPFWGMKIRDPNPPGLGFRRTEREDVRGAKSVFEVGSIGAVGTQSVRGMPHLLTLADQGFSAWPFDVAGWPRLVEIFPRALLNRRVAKTRWRDRYGYLHERFHKEAPTLLERAAGSDDAFDSALSALVMAAHEKQFAGLKATSDADFAIEGRIWLPKLPADDAASP